MLGLVNVLAENITDLLVARVIEPDLPDISAKLLEMNLNFER